MTYADFAPFDHNTAPTYTVDDLMALPRFLQCLNFCNQQLLSIHRQMPREVRYVADLRRWVMTHGALALHFSHKINPDLPPLTATNLFREVEHTGIASPNTVTSYLKEIHARGYITLLSKADQRVRAYAMTEFSEKMFYLYLQISLQGLDLIDNAGRADIASADPRILTHMHPIFARKMLNDPVYYAPPPSIAPLVNTTIGISVLNEMTRAQKEMPSDTGCVYVDLGSASAMAKHYGVSRGNVARLLSKVQNAGHYGQDDRGTWVSAQLLQDHYVLQALKMAHSASAFIEAQQLRSEEVSIMQLQIST
ncbi:hypothetical protein [Gluconobacter japonicus]|uniref:hypothetical protein n=1 Tax=Gluconobacter japonicus TaxID=376620 RepID=UPI001B8B1F9F|nr:hypothetical protein [Gluconobacter japonicus]MBS1051937.1 hypothetical protein [Gluconobacter japonicus]